MVPRLASPNRFLVAAWQVAHFLRFAEFVEGSPHLTEQEVMQYSTWSSEDSEESDRYGHDDSTEEAEEERVGREERVPLGHRFRCLLCREPALQLGHRFTCNLCGFRRSEVSGHQLVCFPLRLGIEGDSCEKQANAG
jgi:hypothetical protein